MQTQDSCQRALGLMGKHVRRFLQKRMQSQLSDVEDLVQESLMAKWGAKS